MMRHLGGLLVLFGFAFAFGSACEDDASPRRPPSPAGQPRPVAPPTPTKSPAVQTPPADPACLVGRWETSYFGEVLGETMGHDVGVAPDQLTAAGGTIALDFTALDASGTGRLIFHADNIVHRAQIREGRRTVNVTHTVTGQATMPYAAVPGAMTVEEPTESSIQAQVSRGSGDAVRMNPSRSLRMDFSGPYQFECTPTEFRVWLMEGDERLGGGGRFDRVPWAQAPSLPAPTGP